MNAEQISKLRREKPRDFDALVAEKVHAFKWAFSPVYPLVGIPAFNVAWLCPPGNKFYPPNMDREPDMNLINRASEGWDSEVPGYATAPAADRASQEAVRTWVFSRRRAVLMELNTIISRRKLSPESFALGERVHPDSMAIWIDPGDWSEAALCAELAALLPPGGPAGK